MTPNQLSRELRLGRSNDLARRRGIAVLSFVGAAIGKIIALYQLGLIRKLPDLPLPYMDSSRVDGSTRAYRRLQTPDGFIMIANYAVTGMLAAAGGRDRHREAPLLPLAMAGKALFDVWTALRLRREEWRENHAYSGYCQAATLASLATAALALPEAVKAARHLIAGR